MGLGQQIKQARENKNLSQEELASKLGVSRQAVSKWENNSAIPQGLNREMLSQILGLEFSVAEGAPAQKRNKVMWLGWGLAAVLLCISLSIGLQLFSLQKNKELVDSEEAWEADGSTSTPIINRVQFYDTDQNIVSDVALWYNAAEIDSILIQWEGGTPDNIKVFYTPGGTETQEQTELLMTKSIPDGDTVALLSAGMLEEIGQGHVYFELNFGETVVVSDIYNIIYNADFPTETSQGLVHADQPMVFVMGRVYVSTELDVSDEVARNFELSEKDNYDTPHIGFIETALDHSQIPEEEMQSNFGHIGSEIIFNSSGIAVDIDGRWVQFD